MDITVEGVPFELEFNSTYEYIVAANQKVEATNSPTIVTFDPPVGPIDQVDFGLLYQQIMAKLHGG